MLSFVGASLGMADRCQLSTTSSMISGSLILWQAGHSACPNSLAAHCQPHELSPTMAEPISNPSPVQVISWDSSRHGRTPAHQSVQLGSPYTCRISCEAHTTFYLRCGAGALSQPINWWSSLRLIRALGNKHPQTPRGLSCRLPLLPLLASQQSEALSFMT